MTLLETASIRLRALDCLAAIVLTLAWPALAASPAGAAYELERQWGSEGSGDGQFDLIDDVAVDPVLEQVFVADSGNDRIQRFDSRGTFLGTWGSRGSGDGQFNRPRGVAASNAGRIFVTDWFNKRVQVFNRTGTFLRKWGSDGSGDGQFRVPVGIAVNAFGDVFVTDGEDSSGANHRVQKFDTSGRFLDKWGSEGSGDGQFDFGFTGGGDVDFDPVAGIPYVADTFNHRIQVFNRFGTFIRKWGSEGTGDGQFRFPNGIAVDSDGDVYVADTSNGRIQKLTPQGTFITKWSSPFPEAVAIDGDGSVYVASHTRIQKFHVVLPSTLITSRPPDTTSDATPTFRFTVDRRPLGATFRCSLDGAAFEPCSSPHTFAQPLRDGRHSFRVRGTDGDGHTDPTPLERRFTVDTVPPETTIDSGPTETIADPQPSFAFSASEAGSSFECDLDGGGFAPCSSPQPVGPLADGAHRYRIRATDEAGNTDPTPAERAFTVDTSVDPSPGDPPPGDPPPGDPPPGDPSPGDPSPEAPEAGRPAQLEIRRARVRGARPARRRLVVRGRLDKAAAGERVVIRYRAGGEQIRLRPQVRENGSFLVSRPLRGQQRRARGGRLSVRFAGTEELRAARERLRASRRAVRLRLDRDQPRIRGSRVTVAGRVVRRARKRVRIAVRFNRAGGAPAEISTRAKVNRRGRFRKRLRVPRAVRDRGAWVSVTHRGRGPLHGQRIGRVAAP